MLNLIFSFSLFSVLGWLLEVVYRSYVAKRFVNPGLLRGPYLILYGCGGVLLWGVAHLVIGANIFVKALVYALLTTFLEFVSGVIALKVFNKRLWDYSENRFNYKGIVCLKFSIYWTALALIFDYFIYPRYTSLISHIPVSTKLIFGLGVFVCMLFDFLKVIHEHFLKYSKEEEEKLKKEFFVLIEPFITHPAVLKLKDSYHHRDKTRLMHVVEVAYISFLIAKKMSLDVSATVKGAMLHDLFYYDWLREGPRLHGFRHPKISLENAKKFFTLSKKEEDIIKKHMWPLTPIPPLYLESLVVSLVDTFCSLRDYVPGKKKNFIEEISEFLKNR